MRSRIDCAFEIKGVSDKGRIEGYGAVFGNVDYGYDVIEEGAFSDSIKSLEGLPMLWQHRQDEPIGLWDEFEETRKGLYVAGTINLEVAKGREARALAAQKAVTGLSIGFFPVKWEYEEDVRILKSVDLIETSLVTFPMNDRARVVGVKNYTRAEMERTLRTELGLSRRAAEAFVYGGHAALKAFFGHDDSGESRSDDGLDSIMQRFRKTFS